VEDSEKLVQTGREALIVFQVVRHSLYVIQ